MADEWRFKKYYDKRVVIETARILDPQFPSTVVCLTGAQVELLRNLCEYLHRRSTFVSEYQTIGYLAPDNDEWEALQYIVADLEEILMGCDIQGLIDAVNTQTDVIDALMQCVCTSTTYNQKLVGALPDVGGYVTNDDITYLSPAQTMGVFTPPPTDTARCELAQAMFYFVYDVYTEKLLPFANTTADTLTALIVASLGFGALALFAGIPILTLAPLVTALVSWGVEGAIENFRNWLLAAKDELVCIFYNALPDTSACAALVSLYIDAAAELSFLDKLVLKALYTSTWAMSWVFQDQEANDTWRAYFIPGQCTLCDEPIPGCWEFGPCDLPTWIGGNVECAYNGVLLTGGASYWNEQEVTPVLGDYLIVSWTPREQTWPLGRAKFGLRRVSDEIQYEVIYTPERAVDVPVVEYGLVPAGWCGVPCYFYMHQASQAIEPAYFCLSQTPPP